MSEKRPRVVNRRKKEKLTDEQIAMRAYVKQEIGRAFSGVQKQILDAGLDLQTINKLKLSMNNVNVILNDFKTAVSRHSKGGGALGDLCTDLLISLENTDTLFDYDINSEDIDRMIIGYDITDGPDESVSIIVSGDTGDEPERGGNAPPRRRWPIGAGSVMQDLVDDDDITERDWGNEDESTDRPD